jgi:uncharacterized protein YjiK
MTISNWKISTVTNVGKRWKITATDGSSPSESAARDFFNGLFGGNSTNYLSLNALDYKYINFKIQSATSVDLFVHMDDKDYDWFPSFLSWSDWTFDGVDVWTAALGTDTIAIGTGTPITAGPFDGNDFQWSADSNCVIGEDTTTVGIYESGGASIDDAIKHSIILSLFNVNSYIVFDGVRYQIAAAPTVSAGEGILTLYNQVGNSPCSANTVSPILKGGYMEPVGSNNVFQEIFNQNSIPSENLKIFYDFKSFTTNPHVQSIAPVSEGTWSGEIFGNAQEFLGFNLDQYQFTASGTGFFKSGLAGYSPAPEVSAVTYNPLKDTLFINEDDANTTDNQYTERNLDGTWIRTITSNIQDSEGMCYMTGKYFAIASEQNTAKIYYGKIDDSVTNLDTASMETITLDTSWGVSKGLEGIAFDNPNECFYGAREGPYSSSDRGVYQIDFDGTTTKLFGPIGITDFAGLHYDPGLENFFILSEQDQIVYQTTSAGTIISQKSIGPMKQPEGITFTSGMERMYIAGEPCEGGYWILNLSGYGCFDREKYIKIANADELYSPNWTMMFAGTRKDNKPSTIFSNFGGYTNPTSGFALGFNSANRLYFHNYENLRPNIYTHLSHNANENIFCVIGQSDSIQVGRYDLGIKGFDFEETSINSDFFRQSDDWYLGTGTAVGIDNYNYDGCLDYFLYFDRSLGVEQANIIASGMYSAITGVAPITRVLPGVVTGYRETITGVTGVIGYDSQLSGQRETIYNGYAVTGKVLMGNVTTTGVSNLYITGDNYTGLYIKPDTWPPGSTTYKELRSYPNFYTGNHSFLQKFNQEYLFSGVDVLSITGMQTGLSGYRYTGYENVYTGAPVTGYLYSGYDYDPLTGDPTVMVLKPSGNAFIPTTKIYNYFFDAVSYLGLRGNTNGSGDAVDYSYWNHDTSAPSWINLGWTFNYNENAAFGFSTARQKGSFFLKDAQSGQINLYFNGVSQDQGQLQTNVDSLYNTSYTTISGDYSLVPELYQDVVNDDATGFSGFGTTSRGQDQVLYDISQPLTNRQRTGISNPSQWASPSALGISGDNVQAFLNGIKIYSGVDYTSVGGYLSATGPITNVTGYLSTFPALATGDWLNQTGVNLYDITGIFISENIYYLNGVRQPTQQFLLYPSGVSLITGVNHLLEGPLDLLYYRDTDYGD